jgi:hypothetical protein
MRLDFYKNSVIVYNMNLVNNKEIKFKNGLVIPVGTNVNVIFKDGGTVCELAGGSAGGIPVTMKLRCSSLPRYFTKFKAPSLKTMEKWSNDGVAKSMLGQVVEPDGYDSEGSPSWMLVAGII